MSIVIVSSLSYAGGEEIAEKAASRLGYKCIAGEVLEDASRTSGIQPEKVRKAVFEAPGLLGGMSLAARKRVIAHLQAAICSYLVDDNVLYHGPLGHLLVKGVTHVLTVRILASKEDRAARKMKEEGCDRREAEKAISREDKHRLSIARELFKADDDKTDPFNLVIDTSETETDAAVNAIAETVSQDRYKPMTYSIQCMKDIELSSRVRASLIELDPDIAVDAKKGDVRVRTKVSGRAKEKRLQEIRRRTEGLDGVSEVEIEAVADLADQLGRRRR